MPKSIDVHAHIIPEAVIPGLAKLSPRVAPVMIKQPDGSYITAINGRVVQNPMPPEIWDLEMRLRDMDANAVDMQVLSNNVALFFYDEDRSLALESAMLQNDAIAAVAAKHPDRFVGIATLPLQDPACAAEELRRSMRTLGLRGAQIGSNVADRNLDDPALEPVWEAANELHAFILVHPHGANVPGRLNSYYMRNFVGLPFETTVAGASLAFGGVLERHPDIVFCLCHAGGFVPFQAGRFAHAWNVRPEAKVNLKEPFGDSLRRLHYDTITHSGTVLRFLIDSAGPEHVLLGSDYPFDMGNLDCVARVKALGLSPPAEARVLAGRAADILGVR